MSTKRLLRREEYTVAWLCALPLSEAVAAWTMLDEEHEELPQDDNDDNTYTYGSIKGHNIVIACMPPGQPGKVSASRMVQSLPASFPNLRIQLFVGIGGGIPCDPPTEDATKDIHLGDVVVGWPDETGASAVVQYDLIRNTGQVKERLSVMDKPSRRLLSALGRMLTDRVRGREFFSSHLTKLIQAGVKGFGRPGSEQDTLYQSDYEHAGSATCDDCDRSKVVKRESRLNPMFHQGTIASGDTVVKDAQLRDEIGRQCHGAKCVEMEAAGVIDQTHCLVIRGIADYADSHKNQIWQPYAAATAAAFARELLLTIQPSAVAKMEPVQKINQIVENEERDRILTWLSPLNFGPRLSDMLDRRQEGTGTWLLESQLFTDWLGGHIRTLWCPGIPGAGKTILASTIVENLQRMYNDTSDVGIGWIYCIYNEKGQTAHNLLASLLRQFCRQKGSLSPEVSKSYKYHCRHGTRPLVPDISRLLHSELKRFTKVYIVIDALDECPESDRTRDVFLTETLNLPSNAYLLVTSRPNNSIEKILTDAERLEIYAHDDDVRRHVAARITNEPLLMNHVTADPSLKDTIVSKITERAQGMFLLAELHIDSLSSKQSLRHLRTALETLPKELDGTYDQAMERIQCQQHSKATFANKVLSWVIFARNPMTIEELQCALAVEDGDTDLDEEGLPNREYLLSVCGGLVMISGYDETLRFIHYTVQEYFECARHSHLSSAQTYLATTCITYLSFSTFATGFIDRRSFRRYSDDHALLLYASLHWGDHVRECHDQDPAIRAIVMVFFTLRANVLVSKQVRYPLSGWDWSDISGPVFSNSCSDVHVAATFGLDWLVEELLQRGANIDARDLRKLTPLHVAAAGGHTNVIKSLLERGANPNLRDGRGRKAIERAASEGHEPATRLLLQEASLHDMQQVVDVVAREGHLGVLRLILESLKNTPDKATYVDTALLRASSFGHEKCIRLLLEELEEVGNLEMSKKQSSLDEALFTSLGTHDSFIWQLLLDHGADPAKGLHEAARKCKIAGAQYFLDGGANIEAVNSEGDRPIHSLLRSRYPPDDLERFLKLLLERGADINAYGSDKKTPLIIVAQRGHAKLVQQLLHNGADILAKDGKFNRSATEWATLGGHLQVVQLLLKYQPSAETGKGLIALAQLYQEPRPLDTKMVDLNVAQHGKDSDTSEIKDEGFDELDPEPRFFEGYNRLLSDVNTLQPEDLKRLLLLHHPASRGDETIVRDFIDMGADFEALDDQGSRALHRAAQCGHTNIIRLLLDYGAMVDPQEENGSGSTPLLLAIRNREYDSVKLLIERGADIDRDSEQYGPPLMQAICGSYNQSIIRLLLERGADPNTETAFGHGGNALHIAVSHTRIFGDIAFDPNILRLLVAKGANLENKDHDGKTPLLLAVRLGETRRVGLLLELGADPTSVEDDTMPMSSADDVDFETAMQLIKAAKQRWINDVRSKSSSASIKMRGPKRKISRISD